MSDGDTRESQGRQKVDPSDLVAFIPWACGQLDVDTTIVMAKVMCTHFTSPATTERGRRRSKLKVQGSKTDETKEISSGRSGSTYSLHTVRITAATDPLGYIASLKFERTLRIHNGIFKVIGLAIGYHQTLTQLTLCGGMDRMALYEISKFLPKSKISHICLDTCVIPEANFYLLLEEESCLQYLSLSKCRINDETLKAITDKLAHPLPGSKSLCALNLSTNFITDIGISYIAQALRSNRKLCYLNLSDNMISDSGMEEICNILLQFKLREEELYESKKRYITYLQNMNELVLQMIRELKDSEKLKKRRMLQSMSANPRRRTITNPKATGKSFSENLSATCLDDNLFPTARTLALNTMGEFSDPFSLSERCKIGKAVFCKGNNTLAYLNVSYNNMSFISLRKILSVLKYQIEVGRDPKGLFNIIIEGNNLPEKCEELNQIDSILDFGLTVLLKRNSAVYKKRGAKSTPR